MSKHYRRNNDELVYLDAKSDEEFAIKAGIVAEEGRGSIADGLTYGNPLDNAAREARERAMLRHGDALLAQDEFDRNELAMRREADQLEEVAQAIHDARVSNWQDAAKNAKAVAAWEPLTKEQRGSFVINGEIDEEDADHLHQVIWPQVARAQSEHLVHETVLAGRMQKGVALNAIRAERGNPDDATWNDHMRNVFNRAHEAGIDLSDESMGSIDFEQQFRNAEIAMAEDSRAWANARFQDAILSADAEVRDGIEYPGGVRDTTPPTIMPKPDYARAFTQTYGGGHDESALDIREGLAEGIVGDRADAEYRHVIEQADALFAAEAERA
jgi:hypothetical protein